MRLPRLGASANVQYVRSSLSQPQSMYACISHLELPILEGGISIKILADESDPIFNAHCQ